MEVGDEWCCGLDVPAKTVVACLIKGRKEIRPCATLTDEVWQLGDWLRNAGCTHVAIERTGVYGKPGFNLLEGLLTVTLVKKGKRGQANNTFSPPLRAMSDLT